MEGCTSFRKQMGSTGGVTYVVAPDDTAIVGTAHTATRAAVVCRAAGHALQILDAAQRCAELAGLESPAVDVSGGGVVTSIQRGRGLAVALGVLARPLIGGVVGRDVCVDLLHGAGEVVLGNVRLCAEGPDDLLHDEGLVVALGIRRDEGAVDGNLGHLVCSVFSFA